MAIWHRPSTAPAAATSRTQRRAKRKQKQLAQVLRRSQIEQFEPRQMLAVSPQLVSIIPNAGDLLKLNGTEVRNEEFRELTFRFDPTQTMDEVSAQNGGIRLVRSVDGVFGNGNDIDITPTITAKNGFIGLGDRPNEIVVRFSDHLPDDVYQIRIVGAGSTPLRNIEQLPFNNAQDLTVRFELDLGPQIIAVVPQPITRVGGQLQQARNEIEVYFNNDDLNQTAATNPDYYQLIRTRKTANNLDDAAEFHPTSVVYDPATDKVRLIFATDLSSLDSTESVYRLRIGNHYNAPLAPIERSLQQLGEAADTFTGAVNVNQQISSPALTSQAVILQGEIKQVTPYGLELPGGNDEPGHRDIPARDFPLTEVRRGVDSPHVEETDITNGVETFYYSFKTIYGKDPQGNSLTNLMSPTQKQRAREAFEYYAKYLGVQFIEVNEAFSAPPPGTDNLFVVALGDLRAVDPITNTGPGNALVLASRERNLAVVDNAEDWGESEPGGAYSRAVMQGIGQLLGMGHAFDLPAGTIMGDTRLTTPDAAFPGDQDIVHGQHVHRPESNDIDVYKFTLNQAGMFSAEIAAERFVHSSLLDSVLWVYSATGELISRNDDYYSKDSFVELELQPGDYYVAVTSTGVSEIDPAIPNSAFGGTTEGNYELRLNFKPSPERNPTAASGLVDIDGTPTLLDGDADGKPGGEYNFWFTTASPANTFIVDKSAPAGGTGTLASPFNSIPAAFAAATSRNSDGNSTNDVRVVRIVGNGGTDNNAATLADNLAYEVGFNSLGQPLADGSEMQVPKGVTVMVDAGAVFKLRRANIDVGSRSQSVDRSEAHLQVLGTPTQSVYFTSYHNETLGRDTFALPTTPAAGDWGGIVFRNELDYDAGRTVLENEGIFINYVNHANFGFGGGDVVVAGIQGSFSPIHLNEARPSVSFNTITNSAGAGIGADPNSFKDNLINDVGRVTLPTNQPKRFHADYSRIGPEIYFNRLTDNTINGLFVAIDTAAGQVLDRLEVSARFNDTDIVHVISEHLIIQGTPGGALDPTFRSGTVAANAGVVTLSGGTLPSWVTGGSILIVRGAAPGQVTIANGVATIAGATWPIWAAGGELTIGVVTYKIATRNSNTQITLADPTVFLSTPSAYSIQNTYTVKSRESNTQFTLTDGSTVVPQGTAFILHGQVAQLDARLRIDPGILVKLDNARIETEIGATLIAEGSANNRVVFTSLLDDRFGGSGTFDTAGHDLPPFSQGTVSAVNGVVTLAGGIWPTWAAGAKLTVNGFTYTVNTRDSDTQITLVLRTINFGASPFVLRKTNDVAPGDWGGLYFGPLSSGSVDNALITYAGGITPIEGGFGSFNPVEIQQAEVRITNSVLEKNENGMQAGRNLQRFANSDGTIFVRGAQPVIVNNIIRDNSGAAVTINVDALNSNLVQDWGRSTGALLRTGDFITNQGPVIDQNLLGNNGINGMVVRGGTLTTQSVWDDTDIVHVVDGEVIVPNHHTFSGLRLQSSATQSLVVKFADLTSGLTASGTPLDINDRIGGSVQVIGTPGHPVVMTAISDSTVGAGFDPSGNLQTQTLSGAKPPQSATSQLDIQFKVDPLLANNAAMMSALNLAASLWESVLDDAITVVIDVSMSALGGPIGLATPVFDSRPYDTVRQLMIADAGANEAIVSQLPTFAQLQATLPDQTYAINQTMDLTRANLLALGVPASQLVTQPSQFDPLTPIDSRLQFDQGATFDFNPGDGITQGTFDFVAIAAHEIGHALGFLSAVDDVDAGNHDVHLNTLDLFRMAPGAGAADFTNSPRLLDPAAPLHVFYDGGLFNRPGLTVAPLTPGDIPMSRGVTGGDGFQGGHWRDDSLTGVTPEIGIMDPVITSGIQNRITSADRRAFDLIGYNVVSRGSPGDWRSVKLDQYSNDRNVSLNPERESVVGANDSPLSAQILGELAPDERSGDENRRLGFEIHGTIETKGDVDVYSFTARAGTEVWLDIDRTAPALDTIIELVNASGNVLARSNDSVLADQLSPGAQAGVYPMQRDVFSGIDLYSTNRHDAGLRLILPGAAGTQQTYYVRVRSNVKAGDSLDDQTKLHAGQSRGGYQLQVRLREIDEIPGSTVQYADIRYASNGIEVLGMPGHSPLLGESAETTANNDTRANAQDLGNVLTVDRGAISVAGSLTDYNDVDWYKFLVDWDKIDDYPDGTGIRHDDFASLIFDIDFADGAGRPDTTLALYDETGTLIYVARDSGVEDDQRAPDLSSDLGDIQRGSFGPNDPFLGPVMLRENAGKTYYLAVMSDAVLPDAWKNSPFSRLEPSPAQDRLIDDRTGSPFFVSYTNEVRQLPGLFFDPGTKPLNSYADPWHLGDVTLFVHDRARLYTVDPYTGGWDTDIGRSVIFNDGYGDLAMRSDGRLHGMALGGNPGQVGNTVEIGADNAAGASVGDDGLTMPVASYQAMTIVDAPNLQRISYAVTNNQRLVAFNDDTGTTDEQLTGADNDETEPVLLMELDAGGNPTIPFTDMVTGLAVVGPDLFGVTDTGKLITIDRSTLGVDLQDPKPVPAIIPAAVTVIATLMMPDPLNPTMMVPIPFSGLSKGPANVEGRTYAQMLFATDSLGGLHTFDTMGVFQNVLAGGRHSVDTGLPGLTGLAFSSLDYNLWHTSDQQQNADGRGIYPTPDGNRGNVHVLGGTGYYFGIEDDKGQPGARLYGSNTGVYDTYNLPGGAHGTLTTDTFSLVNYSADDAPTLYFNYFSQHDSDNNSPPNSALDSFRAYASNDGANWFGLTQTPVPRRLAPNTFDGTFTMQNDVGGWRQARVDLSRFAGQDNLRIRFDFNTSGGRDLGLTQFTGEVLGAKPGAELLDGQFIVMDHVDAGLTTFEFDLGFSLVVPNGGAQAIADGETFTIDDGTGPVTFEFDKAGDGVVLGNTAIAIAPNSTARALAQAITTAIANAGTQIVPHLSPITPNSAADVVIGLEAATDVTQSSPAASTGIMLRGDAPGTVTQVGAIPVVVNSEMTAEEVAIAIAETMDDYFITQFANGIDDPNLLQTAKVDRDAIYIMQPSTTFTAGTGGFLQIFDPGPLYYSNLLPGDPLLLAQGGRAGAGRNNAFEGVILDDFIVGLAERGEVATNVPAGNDLIPTVPMRPVGQVLEGAYQLEIRRGPDYGFPLYSVDTDGTIRYGLEYTRGWDSNDRFADGTVITMPAPSDIPAGTTFTVNDGVNTVVFEFDLTGDGNVAPGHVAVDIAIAQNATEVARAVGQAINSNPLLTSAAGWDAGLNSLGQKFGSPTLVLSRVTSFETSLSPIHVDQLPVNKDAGPAELYDSLGRSIQFTIQDPSQIPEGTYITLNDGQRRVLFEFDRDFFSDIPQPSSFIQPLSQLVDISTATSAADVAAALIRAIQLLNINDVPKTFPNGLVPPGTVLFPFPMTTAVTATQIGGSATVRLQNAVDFGITVPSGISTTFVNAKEGDTNPVRDQGQIVIRGNTITNSADFGIRYDAAPRDATGSLPHPGAVRNLNEFNTARLVRGVSISNNVISGSANGGILVSGDPAQDPQAPIPVARIYNNTIFGGATPVGVGVRVANSSPTILNNALSGLITGIEADIFSASTVVGATLFHRNLTNTVGTTTGTFPIVVPNSVEIFVNPAAGNFYPIAGSALIDSSLDTLQERPALANVMTAIGYSTSPLLAPDRDALGQLRVNDPAVASPPGLGSNVFKDRGAIDRADFAGPTAALIDPVTGNLLDASVTTLPVLETAPVLDFPIQLIDGMQPADPAFGSGIDDQTVINGRILVNGIETPVTRVTLLRDGVPLVQGLDYIFSYDSTNNVIHLRPAEGVWTTNHVYKIRLDNTPLTGIRDLAGNVLKANNLQGTTEFTLTIDPVDFGDAPGPYPTLFSENGAHHRIVAGFHLGSTITAEVNGQPSQNALTDNGDDGVVLPSGFVVGESRQITVTASGPGRLDAWVDFNRDGDWNDAGEQIFASRSLTAGPNPLTVAVPAGAAFGETYARFRFSSAGGLSPTGPANDGEVEDYRLEIQAVASYTIDLKYTNDREMYRDLLNRYFVSPGLEIIAEVYAKDNRTVGAAGVQQAFADLVYDNDLIDFDAATLAFGPSFTSGRAGTVDEPNQQIDEAGGIAAVQPANAGRQLLFRVRGTVKPGALAEQTFNLSLNSADVTPAHNTLLFNNAQPVQAFYESEPIVVKANAWQNAANRFDVNHDGFITGLDALIVINRLNLQGPAVLPVPGQSIPTDNPPTPLYPAPFYDINGDGRVTATDALGVINELNAGRGGAVIIGAGGSAAPPPSLTAAGDGSTTVVATATSTSALPVAGVPVGASFDVTPLAISVAGSGSTAIPGPVGSDNRAAERTTLTRSAVGTAIVDLFGGDDESESGTAASQTAPTANAVEEVLADDASWQNPLPAHDEPVVVAAGSGVDDFMSAFDAWDLECFGKKKKTAV